MSATFISSIRSDSNGNVVDFYAFPYEECFKYNNFDDYYAKIEMKDGKYYYGKYSDSSCNTNIGDYGSYSVSERHYVLDGTVNYDAYYYSYSDSCVYDFPKYNKEYILFDVCCTNSLKKQYVKYKLGTDNVVKIVVYSDTECQTESGSVTKGRCGGYSCIDSLNTYFTCEEGSITGTGDPSSEVIVSSSEETPIVSSSEETPILSSSEETPIVSSSEETPILSSSEETPIASSSEETTQSSETDNTDPDFNNGSYKTTIISLIVCFIAYVVFA
ncbi:hypothetical protein QTN25_008230 [Entamoeba marina]